MFTKSLTRALGRRAPFLMRSLYRAFVLYLAPQHVELMSKDEVLGLQRSPRPEHSNQGAPDQPAKIAHRERLSADSRSRSAVLSLR
jgi:hypothetical protein